MDFGEKLAKLRRQQGWSQEELANRLEVTRQSVSKWESGASVPDLDKIVKLSQIFGVSTDYLLKDESSAIVTARQPVSETEEPVETGRQMSETQVREFLNQQAFSALRIGLGVALCILSPVLIILLGAMSEQPVSVVSEGVAGGVGVAFLLAMVACAVALFITTGMKLDSYSWMEKDALQLDRHVRAEVQQMKSDYEPQFRHNIVTGVCLCILSCVPLILVGALTENEMLQVSMVAVLLGCVALGVYLFVASGIIHSSYDKLLEEGEYTRERKHQNKRDSKLASIYWSLVTAAYLVYSFVTMDWGRSWIIWPVAGVLFGAVSALAGIAQKKK